MKNLQIVKTNWNEMKELLDKYFSEIKYVNDGFLNFMIADGEAYQIKLEGITCGFFSLGNSWDKGKMFRTFYIIPEKRRYAADIFEQIRIDYDMDAALVASNDYELVSLAFETMNRLGTRFDMQAYNFIYHEPERPAEYGMEYFEKISESEIKDVERLTDGLWDGCFDDPDFTFYGIKEDGKVLGYGAIGKVRLNRMNVDVGNFTMPEYRQRGVGRSLIINLCKTAISEGFVPVAGCWYGNTESIMTLKSSGMIPENRIFYVRFK